VAEAREAEDRLDVDRCGDGCASVEGDHRQQGTDRVSQCVVRFPSSHPIARFVEWFRICLRHGWLGNHPKQNNHEVLYRRGDWPLHKLLVERRRQGINLPYGPKAHALGWRSTADIPPWIPPPKRN
jgi:hypothetical protein